MLLSVCTVMQPEEHCSTFEVLQYMSCGRQYELQCTRTQNIPVKLNSELLGLWFGLRKDMA